MKIMVGSKNKEKIEAVAEILKEYPHLAAASGEGVEVASGVSEQPKALEESIRGAMNRARVAMLIVQ